MLHIVQTLNKTKTIQPITTERKSYTFKFSSSHEILGGAEFNRLDYAAFLSDGNAEVRFATLEQLEDSNIVIFNATVEVSDFYGDSVFDSIASLLKSKFGNKLDSLLVTIKSCNLRVMNMDKFEAEYSRFISRAKHLLKKSDLKLTSSTLQIGKDVHISAIR